MSVSKWLLQGVILACLTVFLGCSVEIPSSFFVAQPVEEEGGEEEGGEEGTEGVSEESGGGEGSESTAEEGGEEAEEEGGEEPAGDPVVTFRVDMNCVTNLAVSYTHLALPTTPYV